MSTAPPAIKTSFWTLDRVADALDPLSPVNLPRGTETFGRVWTDTRTIETGDLFVALVGERFDAHDFVAQAVASGAAHWARSVAIVDAPGPSQSSRWSAPTARRARRS
jgi:UDP-N-acetylmuramoyl-tripeptide--D-alanyl-D-alanine ligase